MRVSKSTSNSFRTAARNLPKISRSSRSGAEAFLSDDVDPKHSRIAVLDHWRLVEAEGPHLIEGTLDGSAIREPVLALTLEAGGVAALKDRWVILGTPGCGLAVVDEDAVIARAAAGIRV